MTTAVTRPVLRSPAEGADTLVWLVARDRPVPSGRLWFDRRARAEHPLGWTRVSDAEREALVAAVFRETDGWAGEASPCAR